MHVEATVRFEPMLNRWVNESKRSDQPSTPTYEESQRLDVPPIFPHCPDIVDSY